MSIAKYQSIETSSQSIASSIAKSQSIVISIAKYRKYCKKYCKISKVFQNLLQNLKVLQYFVILLEPPLKYLFFCNEIVVTCSIILVKVVDAAFIIVSGSVNMVSIVFFFRILSLFLKFNCILGVVINLHACWEIDGCLGCVYQI